LTTLITKGTFLKTNVVEYERNSKPQHDLILGTETMKELGIVMDFKSQDDIQVVGFLTPPEIQHDRRGRGVPTLTSEEVTIREGERSCCSCIKKEIMSLRLKVKVIFNLQARSMCIV
jgi:hypothetical protein